MGLMCPMDTSNTSHLKRKPIMGKTIHLVLALACAIGFTTNLSAQDAGKNAGKKEKPKAAKKAKEAKGTKALVRYFGAAELTQEQQTQLKSLLSEKKEELGSIRKELGELVSKEDAKAIRMSVRKALKEGKSKADAQTAALSETDLSAEDQAKVASLQKRRDEIEKGIADQVSSTFSESQKAAMKAGAAKAKKGKEKGAKKKKGKKAKAAEDLTSVSVSLPGMT